MEDEPGGIDDKIVASLGEKTCRMLVGLGFKDLCRNDLSAPDVHYQIEVVENTSDGAVKIGNVPGPNLTGAGGHKLTRLLGARRT